MEIGKQDWAYCEGGHEYVKEERKWHGKIGEESKICLDLCQNRF